MNRLMAMQWLVGILLVFISSSQSVKALRESNRAATEKLSPFKYRYHVNNHQASDHSTPLHTKEESSDGVSIRGKYSVRMPDGRLQVVTYSTGRDGYVANVNYEDDFVQSGPSFVRERVHEKNIASQLFPSRWDSDELQQDHDVHTMTTFDPDEENEPSQSILPSKKIQGGSRQVNHLDDDNGNKEMLDDLNESHPISARRSGNRRRIQTVSLPVLDIQRIKSSPMEPEIQQSHKKKRKRPRKQRIPDGTEQLEDSTKRSTRRRPAAAKSRPRHRVFEDNEEELDLDDWNVSSLPDPKSSAIFADSLEDPAPLTQEPVVIVRSTRRKNQRQSRHRQRNNEATTQSAIFEHEDVAGEIHPTPEEPTVTLQQTRWRKNWRRQKDVETGTISAPMREELPDLLSRKKDFEEDRGDEDDTEEEQPIETIQQARWTGNRRRQKNVETTPHPFRKSQRNFRNEDEEPTAWSTRRRNNRRNQKNMEAISVPTLPTGEPMTPNSEEDFVEEASPMTEEPTTTIRSTRRKNRRKNRHRNIQTSPKPDIREEDAVEEPNFTSEEPVTESRSPRRRNNRRRQETTARETSVTEAVQMTEAPTTRKGWTRLRNNPSFSKLISKLNDKSSLMVVQSLLEKKRRHRLEPNVLTSRNNVKDFNVTPAPAVKSIEDDVSKEDWMAPSFPDSQTTKSKTFRFETSNKSLADIVAKILEDSSDRRTVDSSEPSFSNRKVIKSDQKGKAPSAVETSDVFDVGRNPAEDSISVDDLHPFQTSPHPVDSSEEASDESSETFESVMESLPNRLRGIRMPILKRTSWSL